MPITPLRKTPSEKSHQPTSRHSAARKSDGGAPSLPPRKFAHHQGRRRFWRAAWRIGLVLGLTGMLGAVAFASWVSRDLPDPNKIDSRSIAQSTKIYARDGSTVLYEVHGDQRRTVIELEDIGPFVKNATLSAEDRDFYKHSGISLRGIFRAVFVDITTGTKAQGGSTITQQLVKNSILTNEKSFSRKLKEIILAYQLERRFSKDQILKLYFNEIPYGSSAYGIEAAARTYFGKRAKDLDLAESAILTAMVKAPTYYSPTGNHRDALLARQKFVLQRMVIDGHIAQAQADEAMAVDVLKRIAPHRDAVIAPHFVFYVRDLLVEKYGDVVVEKGGLRVITTLDAKMQAIAEEEVKKGVEKDEKRHNATNAALVAVDPKTGQILAMVGSRDYFDDTYDGNFNVATAIRNPGSSFKPIVYLSAFMKGYTPDTVLYDLKTDFGPDGSGKNFSPNNFNLHEHGPLRMRNTLAGSLNIPAVKTLYLAGIPYVLDNAEKLGYTTIDRNKVGLALAIGGGGVKLLEHVAAFGVLANGGQRNPTTPLLRIEDRQGKVLEQYEQHQERVVPEEPVRQLNDVMSDNSARAYIFGSRSPLILNKRPVAAKTGTTNNFRDAWTVGFTPSLAAGVWRGNNDNSSMRGVSDGVVVAAPIWHAFMERALQGSSVDRFTKPKASSVKNLVLVGKQPTEQEIYLDKETGKVVPEACVSAWPAEFLTKQKVKEVHSILYYVNKDEPNGPPPANPKADPMFERWEKPIQAWAKKNKYITKVPAAEDCSLRTTGAGPTIAFASPQPNATVTTSTLEVKVKPITGANPITSVQLSLDGQLVKTATEAPYDFTLDLSGADSGFHVLQTTVIDAGAVTASTSIIINYVTDAKAATLYFISPAPQAKMAASDFPQTVRVFARDPADVTSVVLYIKQSDGTNTVLDTVSGPASATVDLSWATTPPGSYQLYVTMQSKSGKLTQSDLLPVTIY